MLQLADKCCAQVPPYGRLIIASWVRVSKHLCVGGVAFGLCGSRRAVIHDVELLCA